MKPLIVILAICTLGYVADHWRELKGQHSQAATAEAHALIIYGTKSSPACVRLEGELNKQGIPYENRDMGDEANVRELTEKVLRLGRPSGQIAIPAADVDGALILGATFEQVAKKMK